MNELVPAGLRIPAPPTHPDLRLEPLTTAHNQAYVAAWSAGYHQIHHSGLRGLRLATGRALHVGQNGGDLQEHQDDWAARRGFTYTVLDPVGQDVLGCLYIYPARDEVYDVHVKSWVRGDRPELDAVLWRLVSNWLAADWPFERVLYAPR